MPRLSIEALFERGALLGEDVVVDMPKMVKDGMAHRLAKDQTSPVQWIDQAKQMREI